MLMATAVVQPEAPDACQCGHSHGPPTRPTHSGPAPSLAHQLWFPWRLIALNPLPAIAVYLVLNTVFISVGFVFGVIADVVTLPGLVLLLAAAVVLALRKVTLLLAYPGQLDLVIRDGEANFARLTRRRLLMFIEAANELASVLGDRDTAPNKRLRFLQAHQNVGFSVDTLVRPLLQALELLEKDGTIGPNGAVLLAALRAVVAFHAGVLSPVCLDLAAAPSKDFEAMRQLRFGAAVSSSCTDASVGAFVTKIHAVRDAIRLIGLPVTETKRDAAWLLKQLCQRNVPDVDVITTLALLRADMAVRFRGEQVWIPGHANHQIDAMFIPAAASGAIAHRPAVIICNPNGGLYEFHHLQMDWIKFYGDLDVHVLLYNYRGYGRTTGTPSPLMHNLDALAIVEYLKTQRCVTKIAVHGESIGGMTATYLASHSKDVDVLIADRTFANIPALAQRLVASWAGRAVTLLTRWDTDSTSNYLRASCHKLLCSDASDEIIHDGASLKSGVALRLELNDVALDVPPSSPRDGTAPPSSSLLGAWLPSPLLALWPGAQGASARRSSEADSRPTLGGPLTEEMALRFSDAVLSIARRAMAYTSKRDGASHRSRDKAASVHASETAVSSSHVAISVQSSPMESSRLEEDSGHDSDRDSLVRAQEQERPSVLSGDTVRFPEELLAVVWMHVACMDGYCGQTLLQAAESGAHDKIRAWVASVLVWGGRVGPSQRSTCSVDPFERQGIAIVPVTVAHVHALLQDVVEQYPDVTFDLDIGYLVDFVAFLHDALARRWRLVDDALRKPPPSSTSGAAPVSVASELPRIVSTRDAQLGSLLPLHCGHNKNFHEREKQALVAFLEHVGFAHAPAPARSRA